jgi:hypothetical protein
VQIAINMATGQDHDGCGTLVRSPGCANHARTEERQDDPDEVSMVDKQGANVRRELAADATQHE